MSTELTCSVVVIADLLADSFGLPKTTNANGSKPKLSPPAGPMSPSKDHVRYTRGQNVSQHDAKRYPLSRDVVRKVMRYIFLTLNMYYFNALSYVSEKYSNATRFETRSDTVR